MSRTSDPQPAFAEILANDPLLGPQALLIAVIDATIGMDAQRTVATGRFAVMASEPALRRGAA